MERPTKVSLYLRVLRRRTLWCDEGVSHIFKVVYSHCCSALSRATVRGDSWLSPAHGTPVIFGLECHKEIVRISSLCVQWQSQSHLKLKDKPVCCLLPRSAGNTGRRIKRPSSLPVSGLPEQLNGKKWRHAGIQTERWEATGEWGDDAWVASG